MDGWSCPGWIVDLGRKSLGSLGRDGGRALFMIEWVIGMGWDSLLD